jgi:hypothetical protein
MSDLRKLRVQKLLATQDPDPPSVPLSVVVRNARLRPPQVVPPLGGAVQIDPTQQNVAQAVQNAAQAVQHVRQVDSSNAAIMNAVLQLQSAVPVILGRIKEVEDHQKGFRAENKDLHDRTVAAIADFRSFAADNFDEIKKGIIASAGFFSRGCFGGIEQSILLRIATCMFLFFCFLFGILKTMVVFYVKMRTALLTLISAMFAGFGPFISGLVFNLLSILVFCIELGWSVLLINTLGSYWPFRMERMGTDTVIALKNIFMSVVGVIYHFLTSLFTPFFDLFKEVTGWDLRKGFEWMKSLMKQIADVWQYICSWVFSPVKNLAEGEVLPIDPESIPESAEFVEHLKGTLEATKSKAAEVASDAKEALTSAAHTAADKVSKMASEGSDYLAYAQKWTAGAKERLASATDFATKKIADQLGGLAEEVPKAAKKSATKTSLFKVRTPRHRTGSGGLVGFEESFLAFHHSQGFDNQMGYIVVMLAMMSEPSFDDKYLDAYLSNPIVQHMTVELNKRIEVMTEFLTTGHVSPSVRTPQLERPLVQGIGMMRRPTRKRRRAKRKRTHKA